MPGAKERFIFDKYNAVCVLPPLCGDRDWDVFTAVGRESSSPLSLPPKSTGGEIERSASISSPVLSGGGLRWGKKGSKL